MTGIKKECIRTEQAVYLYTVSEFGNRNMPRNKKVKIIGQSVVLQRGLLLMVNPAPDKTRGRVFL